MLIIETNSPDEKQLKDIREVERVCKDYDGLKGSICLDTSLNFNRNINSLFLMYEDDKLVSFISLFVPTREEAEVSAFTLPGYRRKGNFRQLYERALAEIDRHGIKEILFVCESCSASGKGVTSALKAGYDFSEYIMKYAGVKSDRIMFTATLCMPSSSYAEELADISCSVFGEGYDDALSMLKNTYESKSRIQYALKYDGRYIGIGSACIEDGEASIYGIGILPEFQGRGYGKELLLQIVEDIQQRGCNNITLEVNSKNARAYNLYKHNAFNHDITYDYYRLILKA